ncbi:YihY/virulence factor BrkB family protein [Roseibium sediminicola]|uniref:YihY/virulence factor BrkB family protein n=1 Tax=Roseibium sediminicola TaxID=2933272 RepID=A0ABT0GXG3_9HYPH|nr:YihY/virulence factor BrkB family protein [Roseibium sp. CAU 1639]MCK7614136.1 YihY/virulence factor BrkB family protein [Roseibium sp. CAU 1639]
MSRGRTAETPAEIPPLGWLDVAYRVWLAMERDHVGLIAAGVAFYGLLAIFPAITALMALSGLVVEPVEIARQLELIKSVVPQEAALIILDQAQSVAGARGTGLGLAFAFSLVLSLYSVSRGIASMMEGLNVAYGETEKRGFFQLNALTLVLSLILVVAFIMGLVSALLLPAVFSIVQLPAWMEAAFSAFRWLVMALLTVTGLSLVYRFGPSRADAKWKWITPGAVLACLLWMAASYGFSVYVANFGSYNKTFGSLAGVIILLMWLWMSAYIVLFGAELNGELEAQTRKDSTTGKPQPMGMRGAVKADVLGRSITGVD